LMPRQPRWRLCDMMRLVWKLYHMIINYFEKCQHQSNEKTIKVGILN